MIMAKLVKTLKSHSNDINTCAFSPTILATGSGDKSIRLWSLPEFEELSYSPLLGHSYYVNCCHFSLFGTMLASCSMDGKIILWDTKNGNALQVWYHPSKSIVKVCSFSGDSKLLVTGATDNALCIFNTASKKLVGTIQDAHENFVSSVSFTPDSSYIVSGSGNGDLKVWDSQNIHAKCLYYNAECQDMGMSWLAISPTFGSATPNSQTPNDKTYFLLATCGGDSQIQLWDLNITPVCNIHQRCVLNGHTANVMMVAFSPDGKLLASGAMDKLVIVWCPYVGNMLFTLESHDRYITSVAFSMDNLFLATGSADKTAMIWKLTDLGSADYPTYDNPSSEKVVVASAPVMTPGEYDVKVLQKWEVQDVCDWLVEIGLGKYSGTFKDNHIDGEVLESLTNDSLSNDLDIKALGHRQKILRGVQTIKQKEDQVTVPTPDEYHCPITRQIMKDPVIAADGYSYERDSIQSWLQRGGPISPMTNEPLANTQLTPNRSLKMIIQRMQTDPPT